MDIVIAGGGPAALECAIAARKYDPEAKIAIYSGESLLPYRRPALSGLLAAGKKVEEKSFFIKTPEFLAAENIAFHPDSRAVAVNGKVLELASGQTIAFDRLIIACGSNAVMPPIPGNGNKNVFTLRSYSDMLKIREILDKGIKNAVVIGGGVLGLEIAESLLSRQIAVNVFEAAPRLFANTSLSDGDAGALLGRLNSIPLLKIICGKSVKAILPDSVESADGTVYPAEIVIFAAGSRPDLTLAQSAGVKCNRGIVVDEYMRSSREDILAAGDSAEFNGRCFNLYMDAVAGGKVAGTNAAGGNMLFTAKFSPVRFFGLGEKLVLD